MKGLRTLFGLLAILIGLGFVLYFFSFLLYLVPFLGTVLAELDLPQILLSHLVLGIGLFIFGFIMMAKRRSKIASIVMGILLMILTGAGWYFDSLDAVSDSNLVIEIMFMAIGFLFFLLAGILQKGNLKTKREKEQMKAKIPPVSPYPQQPVYQQPAAVPLYQAPVNGWTCPSCGNVNDPDGRFCRSCGAPRPGTQQPTPTPVQPTPIVPVEPAPIVTPVEPIVEPLPAEPTPLMEEPQPVEEVQPSDGWTCKLCNTKNPSASKFCKNCGSPKDVQ